jgi:hypothetical protein
MDYDNNYVNADADYPKISVIKGRTIILAPTTMTLLTSPGRYYYLWQSLTTYDTGKYEVKVTVNRNSRTSIEHDERAFYLY